MQRRYIALAAVVLVLLLGIWVLIAKPSEQIDEAVAPSIGESVGGTVDDRSSTNPKPAAPATKRLSASDVYGAASKFKWSAEVPAAWQAEAVPAIEAINLYDEAASGDSSLEKSQIFIRHFEASEFQTLSTVTIHAKENRTVDGRPAVRYEIEKKSGVANFPNQPSWRNSRHIVTDVRVSDANPSVFYVIAKRPDLSDAIYERFLTTLQVTGETAELKPPVDGFRDRITKKPFGLEVSPTNSPVQPERFQGLHTGIDVEFGDVSNEVLVKAIADGQVRMAGTADGYGGVVVITHAIDGKDRAVIYGHLDPAALPKVGDTVKSGEEIGRLGDGGTSETDGERKHLHFGIRTDSTVDLKGYVSTEGALKNWLDPLTVF